MFYMPNGMVILRRIEGGKRLRLDSTSVLWFSCLHFYLPCVWFPVHGSHEAYNPVHKVRHFLPFTEVMNGHFNKIEWKGIVKRSINTYWNTKLQLDCQSKSSLSPCMFLLVFLPLWWPVLHPGLNCWSSPKQYEFSPSLAM
jgi:hypothetical protein